MTPETHASWHPLWDTVTRRSHIRTPTEDAISCRAAFCFMVVYMNIAWLT